MLVLAPSPKHLFAFTTHVWVIEKVRDREGAITRTRGACAPRNKRGITAASSMAGAKRSRSVRSRPHVRAFASFLVFSIPAHHTEKEMQWRWATQTENLTALAAWSRPQEFHADAPVLVRVALSSAAFPGLSPAFSALLERPVDLCLARKALKWSRPRKD